MATDINRPKYRILIVENEIIIADDLRARLERLGYTVIGTVVSGEEALCISATQRPDLVLMDIVLSGRMDGIDAAEAIRSRFGTPVIFVTAYADHERLERAKLVQPFGYVLKPFQDEDLRVTIEMALFMAEKDMERRNLEKSLKESEDRFRLLYERAPLGYQSLDSAGNFLEVNQAWLDTLGYERNEVVGRNFADFLHPDWRDHFRFNFPRFKAAGEVLGVEFEMVKKDGSTILVSFNGKVGRDSSGDFRQTHCILHDITAIKKAEDNLRTQRDTLAAVFENAPFIMMLIDRDFNVTNINRAGVEFCGRNKESLVGRICGEVLNCLNSFNELQCGQTELCPACPVRSAVKHTFVTGETLHGSPGQVTVVLENREEKTLDLLISSSPAVIEGLDQVLVTLENVTERNRTERELLRKTEELDQYFTLSADMLCIADLRGYFRRLNPRWGEVLGYRLEELENKFYLDFVHPDDLESTKQSIASLSRKEPVIDFVNRYRCRDGSYKWIEWRSQPGEAVVYAAARDITARIKAQEERQRLEEQLRHAHKMEAVGTLAGGIAHDFNNLLQVINGYAQILLFNKTTEEPGYRELSEIQKAGDRASQLVKQLLAFSHKTEIRLRPVDLNQELKQAEKMLRRILPKMVEIVLHLEDRPWVVNADSVQMEQVLFNLGSNASDAMPEGGRLRIETRNVTLGEDDCRTRHEVLPGRYVLLTVTDTGHGMDQESLKHIFEPFYTTKEIGRGTGLGLASVYGIVKSHGGYISCYSEPGLGASFRIYFPVAESSGGLASESNRSAMPKGGTEHILLVDDEAPIRDFARQALERFGYAVRQASSGEKAIEIYHASGADIDLVILDLGMPGMGGYKCLIEILNIDPSARIVIASGYSSGAQVQNAINAGAAAFIAKPYHVGELLTTTRRVLDKF